MLDLFKIALRNVLRNTRRTMISIFAIFIGIGVMVGVRGFINGLQASLVRNVVEAKMGAIQIHKTGYVASIEGVPLNLDMVATPALLDGLRAVPGIRGAAPRITFPVMVNKGDETVFALGSAIDPANEHIVCPELPNLVTEGAALGAEPGMLMSTQLAAAVGAKIGDLITLLANDRDGALNGIELKLVGTYVGRMPGMEKTIIATLPAAQALLRMEGRVTEIALGVTGPAESAEELVPAVAAVAGPPGFEIHTWRQLAKNITDIMKFQNTFLGVASFVFLLVALTLIVNTMIMAVLERVREIGTMMAVGVRRRQVLVLFLLESAVMGLLGGIAGALSGWAAVLYMGWRGIDLGVPGMNVRNMLYPEIALSYVLLTVAMATIGSVLAAIYPAWHASRLRPVEALQHI